MHDALGNKEKGEKILSRIIKVYVSLRGSALATSCLEIEKKKLYRGKKLCELSSTHSERTLTDGVAKIFKLSVAYW